MGRPKKTATVEVKNVTEAKAVPGNVTVINPRDVADGLWLVVMGNGGVMVATKSNGTWMDYTGSNRMLRDPVGVVG